MRGAARSAGTRFGGSDTVRQVVAELEAGTTPDSAADAVYPVTETSGDVSRLFGDASGSVEDTETKQAVKSVLLLPSTTVEVTRFTLATVATESSTLRVTSVSNCEGDAPGWTMVTTVIGGVLREPRD